MGRKLADSTIDKLKAELVAERDRILKTVEMHKQEIEESLESEAASERIPDPSTGEGGTLAFEYEMERQLSAASLKHVQQIEHALERVAAGTYGNCEECGAAIPLERLRVLPHSTLCVDCAAKQR